MSTCTTKFVNGLVNGFSKSGPLLLELVLLLFIVELPMSISILSTIISVVISKNPVANSIMVKIITDNQLNMSWTVAAAKALRKASRSPAWVIDTIVLVTEVPTFDPKIIGMAFLTGAPAETSATMIEVEVDELWTATVTKIPIMIPTMGLLRISELEKSLERLRPPRILKEVLRKVKEQTNR